MFNLFKPSFKRQMESALAEAQEKRMEHADSIAFHTHMAAYYADREARLKLELGHDKKEPVALEYPPIHPAFAKPA